MLMLGRTSLFMVFYAVILSCTGCGSRSSIDEILAHGGELDVEVSGVLAPISAKSSTTVDDSDVRIVSVENRLLNEHLVRAIKRCSGLKSLRITNCKNVNILSNLNLGSIRLKSISVAGSDIDDTFADFVANTPTLISVDVSGTPITDKGVINIIRSPGLRTLLLTDCDIGNRVAESIGKSNLEVLSVAHTNITEKGVAQLVQNRALKILALDEIDLGPSTILEIKTLPQLEALSIRSCHLSNESFQALMNCSSLRQLIVSDSELTPERAAFAKGKGIALFN